MRRKEIDTDKIMAWVMTLLLLFGILAVIL